MLCLHLSFYQSKKLLRSSYLTLVHRYIVYTGSNNSSWSVSPRARREIELARILKPCRASRSKVVAFVAIAIYFLIARTATSIFHKLLMLQHLKRLRREWKILLHITLRNTRRAWPWPRNQFWVESLLQGDFVEEWWKQNFRISRYTFENTVRVVDPDLSKRRTTLDRILSGKSCKWCLEWKMQCLLLSDGLSL